MTHTSGNLSVSG